MINKKEKREDEPPHQSKKISLRKFLFTTSATALLFFPPVGWQLADQSVKQKSVLYVDKYFSFCLVTLLFTRLS